jgi:hypothetical protein
MVLDRNLQIKFESQPAARLGGAARRGPLRLGGADGRLRLCLCRPLSYSADACNSSVTKQTNTRRPFADLVWRRHNSMAAAILHRANCCSRTSRPPFMCVSVCTLVCVRARRCLCVGLIISQTHRPADDDLDKRRPAQRQFICQVVAPVVFGGDRACCSSAAGWDEAAERSSVAALEQRLGSLSTTRAAAAPFPSPPV